MEAMEAVVSFLKANELVLTTAESCTAGLIAARLADVPKVGNTLHGAFVVYTPEAKQHLLGVNPETIERFNLTSEEVAREMARGALQHSAANMAIANTGVTDAVDDAIPPGTQCFAWAFQRADGSLEEQDVFSTTTRFDGSRVRIRELAAEFALSRIPHYFAQWERQQREASASS